MAEGVDTEMKSHNDFLDNVMPHVPSANVDMALLEIKNTIIDFCEKSLILQTTLDPVTGIVDVSDYDLEPPKDKKVTKILKGWYKGRELTPVSFDEINTPAAYNPNAADAPVRREDPRNVWQKDADTFSVYPIPNETLANAITLVVALKPTRSTSSIDDVIYEDYAEIIAHGTLARMFMSHDKPYTDFKLAAARQALYTAGLNVARDRALKNYVRVSKHVKIRRI
jgi:hypothetical protein